MKRFLVFLLAALCALLPMAGASAESTTVKTVVPDSHSITVDCGEGGSVSVGGKTYTGVFTLSVERLGTLTLEALPDSGWELASVLAPSGAGVSIAGRTVTLTGVYEEKTLSIRFARLPEPTNTPTATPTAAPTGTPTATPTSAPTATPTSSPTATPTTAPTATPTGSQTATATPAATADPDDEAENVLYDDYLGTGMGPGQLSIVFDAEYAPKDYELHPVVMGDELFIRAKADEEGQFVRRSLILTARQIQRLHEESELTLLLFQNGGALALAQMDELYTGRMAKLIALGLEEGLSGVSLDGMDWDALPEPALTASQLSRARVEVLVIPQQLEDGREGFTIQVFLRLGEETLEVTELTESLTVCLNAETLITPENRETFAEHYAVALVNEAGESLLPSELRLLPDEVSEPFPDRSERFDVTILPGTAYPAVLYEPSAALRLYRVEALCAPYAGEGVYTIGER